MKVLLAINLIPNKCGAFEKFLISFAKRCFDYSFALHLLLPGEPLPEIRTQLEQAGSVLHIAPDWNTGSQTQQNLYFVRQYCSLVQKNRFSVVSFSFCEEMAVLPSLLWTKLRYPFHYPARTIWHQQSQQSYPQSFLAKYFSQLRVLAWGLDVVAPVCRHAGEVMQQRCIPGRKIVVLYNGADSTNYTDQDRMEKRRSLSVAPDEFMLFSAASLINRKNVAMSIRGIAKSMADFPKLRFFVAGDGEEEGNLRTLAQSLGVEDRIGFLGRRSDVSELISASDLCILTSYNEGLPFFCSEAFGQGRAMICTPAGGIPEVLTPGIQGAIVPFNDSDALSKELNHLIQNPDLLKHCSLAARETFQAKLSLEAMVDSYFSCYFPSESEMAWQSTRVNKREHPAHLTGK